LQRLSEMYPKFMLLEDNNPKHGGPGGSLKYGMD